MTGDKNWSYEKMLPYFKKLETHDVKLAKVDDNYRNKDGPMRIANPDNRTLLADAFVEAGKELGYSSVDYNGQQQTGFSYIQATQINGERMSANRAYLHPVRNRKNLIVSMYSRVLKILINPDTKKAYGVEFIKHNPNSFPQKIRVLAEKEVILSAGAVSSTQLLMLSGIGPEEHLKSHNISVLKDAPVGMNFIDHIVYGGPSFLVDQNVGINAIAMLQNSQNSAFTDYFLKRKGPLTILGGVEGISYVNLNDPQSKDDLPDVELLFISSQLGSTSTLQKPFQFSKEHYARSFGNLRGKNGWMIWPLVLQPKSRGRILLRSADPYDTPKIMANYWSNPDDIALTIKAIKMIIEISKTKAMQKYNSTLHDPGVLGCENYTMGSDAYWECAIRTFTISLWHFAGTCKMGAKDDPTAVVDSRLKVRMMLNFDF